MRVASLRLANDTKMRVSTGINGGNQGDIMTSGNLCGKVILACVMAIVVSPSCHSATLVGKVAAVADGDTVTVLDAGKVQYKIRVSGIDAPEKKQAFGERSKQSMAHMVLGKFVQVEWNKQDRYGRLIGKITTPQENCQKEDCPADIDAGLAQISLGLAWHYKKYEREQAPKDRNNYAQTEIEAKAKQVGLWSEVNPVAPWNFRQGK